MQKQGFFNIFSSTSNLGCIRACKQSNHTTFGSPLVGRTYQAESLDGYRFGLNGKENTNEIYGDGNGVDFGARISDTRLGRWMSLDPFKDLYVSLSSYSFGANNPINIIDEGGKFLKDVNGNIIATPTGTMVTRDKSYVENNKSYTATGTYEKVVIYTDKGTPIVALRLVSTIVQEQGEGNVLTKTDKVAPPGLESNCHGFAFTGGQFVLETGKGDKVLSTIIKDDGYEASEVKEANADGFVISDKSDATPLHSGIKNSNGTWSADHGLGAPTENVPLEQAKGAIGDPGNAELITTTFFKNGKSDNSNIIGVKQVTKEEAAMSGANTAAKPLDGTQ